MFVSIHAHDFVYILRQHVCLGLLPPYMQMHVCPCIYASAGISAPPNLLSQTRAELQYYLEEEEAGWVVGQGVEMGVKASASLSLHHQDP